MCGARRCKSGPDWACAFFATQIFPALGIDVVEVVQNSSARLGPRASGGADDKAEVNVRASVLQAASFVCGAMAPSAFELRWPYAYVQDA